MPAGTWNLGRIRKQATLRNLTALDTIVVRDTQPSSPDYLNISSFPETLTAGKNLFKIRANNDNLVRDSEIYIEILDYNGNPVYVEPINYIEHDGTRVIAVYIYEDTSPGTAKVYIGARAKQNAVTNQKYRSSKDINDSDYFNIPNMIWSRNVTIAPENAQNNTEIIYTTQPRATINEIVQPFLQPINLENVAIEQSGSDNDDGSTGNYSLIITPIPSSVPPTTNEVPEAVPQGQGKGNSPSRQFGQQQQIVPATSLVGGRTVSATSNNFNTVNSFSILTTTGFPLSASMEGGTIIVHNPIVETQDQTFINASGQALPSTQFSSDQSNTEIDPDNPITSGLTDIPLSGSYIFGISNVLTSTKARIYQIEGFRNIQDNTIGAFNAKLISTQTLGAALVGAALGGASAGGGFYNVNAIKASTNFTCSFIEPLQTVVTQQSQSFAEIVLGNTDPSTGDVHHVRTQFKPGGQFGNFVDQGTTLIEQTEILEDSGSTEAQASIGAIYNRIGFFTSLGDFGTYWTASGGPVLPEVEIEPQFFPDVLMSGIVLNPSVSSFSATPAAGQRFGLIHITSSYLPHLANDVEYIFTMNATADHSIPSAHPLIEHPRIDIYVSGSENGQILANGDFIEQHRITTHNIDETLVDVLEDGGLLGRRISTLEFSPSASLFPMESRFTSTADQNIDVYIVVRSGKWTIANVSIKTLKQTGFTPNYVRIFQRVPTEFLDTPLTFKFNYYDYQGNEADVETVVYPVVFSGDNMFVGGDQNLLSGSLYVGSVIGSGVELAGVQSAFIRSIGFRGFRSGTMAGDEGNADISVQPFGDGETFDVTSAQSGFMLYSGSVLTDETDDYALGGIGLDIIAHSSSYIRYRTRHDSTGDGAADTSLLEIVTDQFFLGSDSAFISGAGDGTIAIFSDNFELTTEGGVTMEGSLEAEAGATLGGWEIGTDFISSSNATGHGIILSSSGDLQSKNFQSALLGVGRGWKIGKDGIAEFDECRIRGTLSTAVFEKEKVSAVGGAMIVANATALASGSTILSESLFLSETGDAANRLHPTSSLLVDSAAGFVAGEIIMAKTVSDTGFIEEIMKVVTVTINTGLDAAGNPVPDALLVSRSVNEAEFIHLHVTPTMSAGQTIVSLGKEDTGFILLNATSGSETPYIDIVERTGSTTLTGTSGYSEGVRALDIKVRLGDLSGINDSINGTSVSGYGLYTDNAFLKGGIFANFGKIGGFNIISHSLSSNNQSGGEHFFISGAASIDNTDPLKARMFISSSDFNVKASGELTASSIRAEFGDIGSFGLSLDSFFNRRESGMERFFISGAAEFESTPTSRLRDRMFISSSNFNVKGNGEVTASGLLVISGSGAERRVLFDGPKGGKADGVNNGRILGVKKDMELDLTTATTWNEEYWGQDWGWFSQIGPFFINPGDDYLVIYYTAAARCFTKDTKILMADETNKKISQIKIGDLVKSEKEESKVLDIQIHKGTFKTYSINGSKGFVTKEHPFKTVDGWKAIVPKDTFSKHGINATVLKIGDILITSNGTELIKSIEEINEVDTVYNLSVDNEHVYYANNYLVHNKSLASETGFGIRFELIITDPAESMNLPGSEIFNDDFGTKRYFHTIQPFNGGPANFNFLDIEADFISQFGETGHSQFVPTMNMVQTGEFNGAEYAGVPGMQDFSVEGGGVADIPCSTRADKYPHVPGVLIIKSGVCDVAGNTTDFRNRLINLAMYSRRSSGPDPYQPGATDSSDTNAQIRQLAVYSCNRSQKDRIVDSLPRSAVISPYDGRFLKYSLGSEVDDGQATTECTDVGTINTGPTSDGFDPEATGFCSADYDPDPDVDDGLDDVDTGFDFGFSDRRLKYDIVLVGKSISNINIYNFKYKNKKYGQGTYQGVMANEVPWASRKFGKYYKVDYSKIDVKFKQVK